MNFKEFIKPTIAKMIVSFVGSIILAIYIFGMLLGGAGPLSDNNRIDFKIAEIVLWPVSMLSTDDLFLNIFIVFVYLFILLYLIISVISFISKLNLKKK